MVIRFNRNETCDGEGNNQSTEISSYLPLLDDFLFLFFFSLFFFFYSSPWEVRFGRATFAQSKFSTARPPPVCEHEAAVGEKRREQRSERERERKRCEEGEQEEGSEWSLTGRGSWLRRNPWLDVPVKGTLRFLRIEKREWEGRKRKKRKEGKKEKRKKKKE